MTATLTGGGHERLREAYPHALASVRTNVIDHLDGFDLAAFAEAVGKFATAETGCYPRRLARRQPAYRGADRRRRLAPEDDLLASLGG